MSKVSVVKKPSSGDTLLIGNILGKTVYEFVYKNGKVEKGHVPFYIRRSKKDMEKALLELIARETSVTVGVETTDFCEDQSNERSV